MSRISTLAANTLLLNQTLRTQSRILDGQVAVSSEKKSQNYKGIHVDSRRLVNIEHTRDLLQRYIKNNEQEDVNLTVSTTVVESIQEAVKDLRGSLATFSTFESKDEVKVKTIDVSETIKAN